MRIDRNAAAIVGDGDKSVGGKLDVDEGRVAGHRLVHRIVDHLGEEMMQRLLVGAADIHARTPAHRLQSFQHLDMAGVIALAAVLDLRGALRRRLQDRIERACRRARSGLLPHVAEKVVAVVHAVKFQSLRIAGDIATTRPVNNRGSRSVR